METRWYPDLLNTRVDPGFRNIREEQVLWKQTDLPSNSTYTTRFSAISLYFLSLSFLYRENGANDAAFKELYDN